MAYIPKNIRAGLPVSQALDLIKKSDRWAEINLNDLMVAVSTFDHGRDVCGNGIAHYNVELVLVSDPLHPTQWNVHVVNIVESGKRREQVGYSGANEAALYALDKLGYQVDTSKTGSYDYQGTAYYPVKLGND